MNMKLTEIYKQVIKEYDESIEDYLLRVDDYKYNILSKFLYENNDDYTEHLPWRLISYQRLKRIWEQHAKFNFVRDEKGLEQIKNVMISNTIKLDAITELMGHTSLDPSDYYQDVWGPYVESVIKSYYFENNTKSSKDPNQLEFNYDDNKPDGKKKVLPKLTQNKFLYNILDELEVNGESIEENKKILMDKLGEQFSYYYCIDPKSGQLRISDYGLKPLQELSIKLMNSYDDNEKIVLIDKMLNVTHQRSDLASWFVRGGSNALSDLSSAPHEK